MYLYAIHPEVIRSFRHRGLERFFRTGSSAGIQPKHAARLRLQLGRLESAQSPRDMNLPGWRLHRLKGQLVGHWAIWVDENWRLVFGFDGEDAVEIDYMDYH
jgi:toxin HigB-1